MKRSRLPLWLFVVAFSLGCFGVPPETPARQHVRFHLRGNGMTWVATHTDRCDGTGYQQLNGTSWQSLLLKTPNECGCECTQPVEPGPVSEWTPVGPDGALVVTWDARSIQAYSVTYDCGSHSEHGHAFRWQPVPEGRYRTSFLTRTSTPTDCRVDGATAYCGLAGSGNACRADHTVQVEFTLPESGDVDVNVDVSP